MAMKSFILLAVLAALAVSHDADSVPNEVDLYREEGFVYREDIDMYQKGEVRQEFDIMFHEEILHMPPIPNTVQRRDIHYRGNSTTKINAVRYSRPPQAPGSTNVGALGTNFLTVRVTSAPGDGLYSHFQFFGYYTDWA